MAVELHAADARFRRFFDEAAAAVEALTDYSVLDVLRRAPGAPPLERLDVVQSAMFVVCVALARLWMACGVRPPRWPDRARARSPPPTSPGSSPWRTPPASSSPAPAP